MKHNPMHRCVLTPPAVMRGILTQYTPNTRQNSDSTARHS
ncbi:hypothetical protein ACS15_4149 [Ralstonia insidiosa]|uniref:Uncharacterized protein n=1 Tax=Ralstonia insidiosa TaxID=190721 RepID=A0AAC9BPK5_9RALS|nr:hypothetical protein ACS15_4149 [Ralstonia insidiosa]